MEQNTDFVVESAATQVDDNTVVLTASEDQLEAKNLQLLLSAMQKYDYNKEFWGVKFSSSSSSTELTVDRLTELLTGINSSLSNVRSLNEYVHLFINKDDIFGAAYTALVANINTKYKLTYGSETGRNKMKQLKAAKEVIEQFNRSIRLEKLINEAVISTMVDGNYCMYLRLDGGNATVDHYPLGVVEVTDYTIRGYPVCQINLSEFKSRLRKTYTKDKRGKALYFENLDKEVAANFPPEVQQAYKNGDTYARLEVRNTGLMRINDFGGKYGVSHFAKALRAAVILNTIEDSDIVNDQAKAKKIIHQSLNKEVMGSEFNRKGFEFAAFAHDQLVQAWRNKTVLATTIPAVKDITYVEPKVEGTPTEKIAVYRNEKMTALGIGYIDPNMSSVSAANISVKQLMKLVDKVADQLSDILHEFYIQVLVANGIDPIYAPTIEVLDSAQADIDQKRLMAETLINKMGFSRETAAEVLGYDIDDEAAKRQAENEAGFDDIFYPRANAYTTSSGTSDDSGGKPKSTDPDAQVKQEYDQTYNETSR